MNATTSTMELVQQTGQAYPAPQVHHTAAVSLFDEVKMASMYRFAEIMSKGVSTVPQHLRGNIGDCMAVCMAAQRWGMDPFVVAQKTHSVNGQMGYEAQLVGAVVNTSSALNGRLNFRWFGDWTKIVGKFKWMESKTKKDTHGNPSRYTVPAWDSNKDEEGLGVTCFGTLAGETEPRELDILMLQARIRNSTLWAEDPKQQIAYLAEKRWARLHLPEVLLGVYTPDELSAPRHMGAAEVIHPEVPSELLADADAAANKGMSAYQAFWSGAGKEGRTLLAAGHEDRKATASKTDSDRTVENIAPVAAATPKPTPEPTAEKVADVVMFTFAQVMDRLVKAKDADALAIASDLIGEIADPAQRAELVAKFEALTAAMTGVTA